MNTSRPSVPADEAAALRSPLACPSPAAQPPAIQSMTDHEIMQNLEEITEDLGSIRASRAEIHGEASHYGDGPVGSAAQLARMSESEAVLRREGAVLNAEWKRRHPPAPG